MHYYTPNYFRKIYFYLFSQPNFGTLQSIEAFEAKPRIETLQIVVFDVINVYINIVEK